VLEDLVRREKLRNPHTQFHFWRTAAGLEADLVLDRVSERVAFEIKAGEGEPARAGQWLRTAMTDADARRGFLITQADGVTPLTHGVARRGFTECVDWLPE
jgi:hypothetical protein